MPPETLLEKLSGIIGDFIRESRPEIMIVPRMIIKDEMFYDLIVKYVNQITVGSKTIVLDNPRYFVSFKRNHNEYQFEIQID